VVDHSNAQVAAMVGARVVLIGEAGIGNAIDRLCLGKNLFDSSDAPVAGSIINKMKLSKMEKIAPTLRLGCERKALPVLGIVPYDDVLVYPRLDQIIRALEAEVLVKGDALEKRICCYAFGTVLRHECMAKEAAILLVTPSSDLDSLISNIVEQRLHTDSRWKIAGVLLTAGKTFDRDSMAVFETGGIPVLATEMDTYTTAVRLHEYVAKIDVNSPEKIETVKGLFAEHVDMDRLLEQCAP